MNEQHADLNGRAVLVFGASGALGAGVCAAFTVAGAVVTVADRRRPDPAVEVAGVGYQEADVTDDASLSALFDRGPAPWAVVNTVGGFAPRRPLDELDPAELTRQLELNLVSAALVTKH